MAAAALMLPVTLTPQKTDAARGTAIVVLSSNILCSNCKTRIEKNIAFERGVRDLVVSLPDCTVTITYRTDKTTAEALCQAVSKLGYESTIVSRTDTPAKAAATAAAKGTRRLHFPFKSVDLIFSDAFVTH